MIRVHPKAIPNVIHGKKQKMECKDSEHTSAKVPVGRILIVHLVKGFRCFRIPPQESHDDKGGNHPRPQSDFPHSEIRYIIICHKIMIVKEVSKQCEITQQLNRGIQCHHNDKVLPLDIPDGGFAEDVIERDQFQQIFHNDNWNGVHQALQRKKDRGDAPPNDFK